MEDPLAQGSSEAHAHLWAFGSLCVDTLPHRGIGRRGEFHRVEQGIRKRDVVAYVTDAYLGTALALQIFHLNADRRRDAINRFLLKQFSFP